LLSIVNWSLCISVCAASQLWNAIHGGSFDGHYNFLSVSRSTLILYPFVLTPFILEIFFFRIFQLLQELLKSLNFENLAGVQVTAPVTANAQSDFRRPRRDQRPRAPRAPRAETEVAAQA
jgi:hypothetical protein